MAKWYRTGLLSLELGVQVPLGVPWDYRLTVGQQTFNLRIGVQLSLISPDPPVRFVGRDLYP